MTENDWLVCADPDALQEYLRRAVPVSDRKYRLFACACCRRSLLPPPAQAVLDTVGRFADGLADDEELRLARTQARSIRDSARAALDAGQGSSNLGGVWLACCAVLHLAGGGVAWKVALSAADSAAEAPAWVAAAAATGVVGRSIGWDNDEASPWATARKGALRAEEWEQAGLLRHIIGNPFRPPSPYPFPAIVIQLADALYHGTDCTYALHDGLMEAGHPDLAAHFDDATASHPKGCWVLDLLLGKE